MDKFEIFLQWFDFLIVAWPRYVYECAKKIHAALSSLRGDWPSRPTRPVNNLNDKKVKSPGDAIQPLSSGLGNIIQPVVTESATDNADHTGHA